MKKTSILKYFLIFLPSCSPLLETVAEDAIEEAIELRKESVQNKKNVSVGKSF